MSGLEILALATTAISTGVGVVSQMQQSKAQNAYAEAQNEVTRRQWRRSSSSCRPKRSSVSFRRGRLRPTQRL